jgi:hypothetical protein
MTANYSGNPNDENGGTLCTIRDSILCLCPKLEISPEFPRKLPFFMRTDFQDLNRGGVAQSEESLMISRRDYLGVYQPAMPPTVSVGI